LTAVAAADIASRLALRAAVAPSAVDCAGQTGGIAENASGDSTP
jgi:hypothetical protein